MKKLVALIMLAGIALGGWYFASPWLAMKGLSDAARAGDTAELEERVDFPALRASVSDQISEATRRREGRGGLLDELGGILAERVGREVTERALTPQNVGTLIVSGSFAAGMLPERLRGQRIEWDVEREGFEHFRAVGTFEDGTGGPTLLFARDGLGWDLTGIELP
ncbi:DUF2939 domain-containing protein [Aurantiacibacter poecillastricola]|uniref:DUF2939 domain-containing protein n=1 Tax=Aurantiacibacter poecillastricola TaxID=3064385 RepID=UPI00273D0C17|nr:DUF2939 domain-containing protein [Aurantiacibacter sp. 219JJ12-13]MDP5262613.1 DUF2939 domain-containing protein [Aurantiacibacter sp. 219JJ12-13]